MWPTSCPERSVAEYKLTLPNIEKKKSEYITVEYFDKLRKVSLKDNEALQEAWEIDRADLRSETGPPSV
jgi:hypothetical protein